MFTLVFVPCWKKSAPFLCLYSALCAGEAIQGILVKVLEVFPRTLSTPDGFLKFLKDDLDLGNRSHITAAPRGTACLSGDLPSWRRGNPAL